MKTIPVVPLVIGNSFLGQQGAPIPTHPLIGQATTKPLCLCNLQRQKDEERRRKKESS